MVVMISFALIVISSSVVIPIPIGIISSIVELIVMTSILIILIICSFFTAVVPVASGFMQFSSDRFLFLDWWIFSLGLFALWAITPAWIASAFVV